MGSVIKFTIIQDLDQILCIVRDLREQGYRQGLDFDFAYKPERTSIFNMDLDNPPVGKHAVFDIYNSKLATVFALKYNL